MGSTEWCQVLKSSSKIPISTNQEYKDVKKRKLRLHLVYLLQAGLCKILYTATYSVMLNSQWSQAPNVKI